jgi:hypothetical protein
VEEMFHQLAVSRGRLKSTGFRGFGGKAWRYDAGVEFHRVHSKARREWGAG